VVQEGAPDAENSPAEHGSHALDAGLLEKVPARHISHPVGAPE